MNVTLCMLLKIVFPPILLLPKQPMFQKEETITRLSGGLHLVQGLGFLKKNVEEFMQQLETMFRPLL